MDDLPLWEPQRRTAAANEQRILDAARELLGTREAGSVEMRDIARAAGVGVGTVYRRFGDKGSLLAAVVGEEERALQDAIHSGPPPLGPGAPAAERLDAFLAALVRLTDRNLGVLLATDATPPGRLGVGAYAAWRQHVVLLLDELGVAPRTGWWADLLLAPLDPPLFALHRRRDRMSVRAITAALQETARRVAADR